MRLWMLTRVYGGVICVFVPLLRDRGYLGRDGVGQIIALFSGPLGIMDSNESEICVIALALTLFVKSRWKGSAGLVAESDSRVALEWVLHIDRRSWGYWNVSMHINYTCEVVLIGCPEACFVIACCSVLLCGAVLCALVLCHAHWLPLVLSVDHVRCSWCALWSGYLGAFGLCLL
ncbi:hypothetical protein GQ457_08G034560 [Hibiscus cannabinus]